MPLERSHIIVICSVSPLIVGLAAFYWFRSRSNNLASTDNSSKVPNSPIANDNSENVEMTRQNRDKCSGRTTDVINPLECSNGQPVASVSSKVESHVLSSPQSSINVSTQEGVHTVPHCGSDSADLCKESVTGDDNSVEEELVLTQSENCDLGSSGVRVDSNFSDTHTEVSADSGVGGNVDSLVFRFDFPSDLVGLLIGNHGRNVKMLQEKSGARVHIERSHFSSKYQVCVVEGSSHCVDLALELIRDRFPHLDLSQLTGESSPTCEQVPLPIPQLRIPQHTFSEVCISNIVNVGHVYLQQPTHPYFRELELLTQQMNAVYSDFEAPLLPEQTPVGVICAAPWIDQIAYCRALILSVNESAGTCQVQYVDHGSTVELPTCSLRQIRSDFLRLPFQATESYLSNIAPLDGAEAFSLDAANYLLKMTEGCVLYCWVHGFASDGKPLVELYIRHGTQKMSVNKLLVENGFAKWIETA